MAVVTGQQLDWQNFTTLLADEATPIKCLDLDETSGQLKQEGWLYIV